MHHGKGADAPSADVAESPAEVFSLPPSRTRSSKPDGIASAGLALGGQREGGGRCGGWGEIRGKI